MVSFGRIEVNRNVDCANINRHAAHGHSAFFNQSVFDIAFLQEISVHRHRQINRIAIPREHIKRTRRFAFEIIITHIIPHQILRTQERECGLQFQTAHNAAFFHLCQAITHKFIGDKVFNITRIAVINH